MYVEEYLSEDKLILIAMSFLASYEYRYESYQVYGSDYIIRDLLLEKKKE